MADEKNVKQAEAVYASLCKMLDEHSWHYDEHKDDLTVHCVAQGEDLPIELTMEVDAKRLLVTLMSPIPFAVPADKRGDLAIAVTAANYGLVDGNFDYDYHSGRILWRMTSSYRESLIGKGLLEYMLFVSCGTIDNYNDKFLMVAKSNMSAKEIVEFIK